MTLVLLFDNECDFRELLCDFFRGEGYDVEVCPTPEDVAYRGGLRPDAIAVVDAWGRSTCRLVDPEARSIRTLAACVPTVMLTARTWAADVNAVDLGLRALLEKPIDLNVLLEEVTRMAAHISGSARRWHLLCGAGADGRSAAPCALSETA